MENITDIVFFIVCKIYFLFETLDSKRILNTLKKVLHQPWNALTLQQEIA